MASRPRALLERAPFLATKEYQWAVGTVALGAPAFVAHLCEHGRPPAAPVRWLTPAPRPFSFVTDPRCITWKGEVWVFFEAFRPWAGRGVIGVARYDERLGFVDPRPVLDVPGLHLAYPTVLAEGDGLVCLPDSSCPDGTLVFRGTDPASLRAAGTVPGVPPLRDPTVLELDGGLVLVGLDIRPRSPVLRAFRATGARRLIHGHTHRPAIHPTMVDGVGAERIVLAPWYEAASCLAVDAGGVRAVPLSR